MEIKLLVACLCLRFEMSVAGEGDGGSGGMTEEAMWQTGTMDSVPWGLRCDLVLRTL